MALSRVDRRNLKLTLLVVAGIFVVLFSLTYLYSGKSSVDKIGAAEVLSNVMVTDPESGDGVMLSTGSAQLPPEEYGGFVHMSGPYLKVGEDYFGIVSFNYGGSGVFEYLGMWSRDAHDVLEQRGALPLGDRVKVTGITANGPDENYTVTVDYHDYGPDQSMADAPNIEKQVVVDIKNHTFLDSN